MSEKVTASVQRQSDDPGGDRALAKIRYETSLDDLIAFSLLHRPRTAPSGFGALLAILVGAIGAVILIVADKQGSPLWVYFACFAGGLIAFAILSKMSAQARLRHWLADGENKAAIGWRELEIGSNDLFERHACGSSIQGLESIERIVCVGNYAFVYITAVAAHVIPRLRVIDGDFDGFVRELQAAWARFHPDVALGQGAHDAES